MCFCSNGFCCRRSDEVDNGKTFVSSDNEIVVIERRYGCYRLGILVACIIVLVLMVGTIPASLSIRNNKIVLIFICATLVVVLTLLSVFFVWQQRQARRMRERYGRPYVPHVYNNQNAYYTSVPTSTQTSWLFWSSQKNKNQSENTLQRSPGIQHNPTKISTLQQVSEAPQYTTIV